MNEPIWDRMATLYDETRVYDKTCLNAALDYLVNRFPPEKFRRLLEPGIGTGRIAFPLVERGYQVEGVDRSKEMLSVLEDRLSQSEAPPDISVREADVTALPYSSGYFDIAVPVHLFYFIREWKAAADELLRVVKTDGPVVLMHTGTGMEVPFLNDRYRELCAEQGCIIGPVGVTSTIEVVDYYSELGCQVESIRDRWGWTSRIQLKDAVSYLRARAYSFTDVIPDDIHNATVTALETEVARQYGHLEVEVDVPNQVYLVVVTRPCRS